MSAKKMKDSRIFHMDSRPYSSGALLWAVALMAAVILGCAESPRAVGPPTDMKMATEIPESILMPDSIDSRIGRLEFFDGFPTDETAQKAYDFLDFQRAVDTFLDEMRAASSYMLREGMREIGVTRSSQVLIFETLMDSKSLWLTPNTETVYASTFLDLKTDGPTVIESPPNVLGILDDMWMRYVGDIGNAGPDKGQGGKFLILPPGYEGEVPGGYFIYRSQTYGVWLILRGFLVDGGPGPAVRSIKERLRIYPRSEAANPPVMEFKNASGLYHNTIHSNDFRFFEEMNALVQEEHEDAISPEARGRLALLGIVKGEPFAPDERMRQILDEGATVGAAIARTITFAPRDEATYIWPGDANWINPFTIGNHEFLTGGYRHLDARVMFHYAATGITPAMAIAMPGIGSQYAGVIRDRDGKPLDGSRSYKLTLPRDVPAKDFWSVVLYDVQTRSMLQTDTPFPSLNSERGGVEQNADGTTDIYFGPTMPEGKESNWVQTVPGKGWFMILRLYGPLQPWFDQTWRPGQIEPL